MSTPIRLVAAAWGAVLRILEPLRGSWESVCDKLAASSGRQVGEGWGVSARVIAAISGHLVFLFSYLCLFLLPLSRNQMSHVLTAIYLRGIQSVKETSEVN